VTDETLDALLAGMDQDVRTTLGSTLDIEAGLTAVLGTDPPPPQGSKPRSVKKLGDTMARVGADTIGERPQSGPGRRRRRKN
jgi:hypothetical protein